MYLIIFAIFILSAATLGYEILLLRLFSIVLWHNYAYIPRDSMVNSVEPMGDYSSIRYRSLENLYGEEIL